MGQERTWHAPRHECKQEWLEHLDPEEVWHLMSVGFAKEHSLETFMDVGQHCRFQ